MHIWEKRKLQSVVCVLFFLLFFAGVMTIARAAGFSYAQIKPSRMQISTNPLPILISGTVSDVAVEDHVRITLGSAWSGSGSASSYTVSTSGLPAGVSPWPGIATADSLAGAEISFPSSDLTTGVLYGFYLTGGVTAVPSTQGSSGEYIWQLATISGGSAVSQSDVSVPAVASDQVVITGQVLPPLTDFSAQLSTADSLTDLAQATEITFTVTYGSDYDFSTPLTVVADWTLGTVEGGSTATVELLEYVSGSATAGYGSTSPVIDLGNRTITWTIPSFPANTLGETVSFTLRTTGNYTATTRVTADVQARITEPIATTDSVNSLSYIYVAPASTGGSSGLGAAAPTATPTQATSGTVAPSPTTTPPQGVPPALRFTGYMLTELTDKTIGFIATLSRKASIRIEYGTAADALTQKLLLPAEATLHRVALTGLRPKTVYFVRMIASDGTSSATSDLLSFTTAQTGENVVPASVSYTSSGAHLFTSSTPATERFLFPISMPLEITLDLRGDSLLSLAQLVSIDESGAQGYLAALSRTQPGVWTGKAIGELPQGDVALYAQLWSVTGTFQSFPLGMLRFSNPITVSDAQTKKPIERARMFIKKYDSVRKVYELVRAPDLVSANPLLSESNGTFAMAFSPGTYQLEVQALGYDSQQLTFDTQKIDSLPQLALEPAKFPVFERISYHFETMRFAAAQGMGLLEQAALSSATVRLFTLWTIAVTSPLTLISLLAQFHFSLKLLVRTILGRHVQVLHHLRRKATLHSKVVAESTGKGIAGASVSLMGADGTTKLIIQTHSGGRLSIPANRVSIGDTLMMLKAGFVPQTTVVASVTELPKLELTADSAGQTVRQAGWAIARHVLASLFELNLSISLILSISFTLLYHTTDALPFVILSGMNALAYVQQRVVAYVHATHFVQT